MSHQPAETSVVLWIRAQVVGGGASVDSHITGAGAEDVYFSIAVPRYPGEGKRDTSN